MRRGKKNRMVIEGGVSCFYREMEERSKDSKGWRGLGWVWFS